MIRRAGRGGGRGGGSGCAPRGRVRSDQVLSANRKLIVPDGGSRSDIARSVYRLGSAAAGSKSFWL